MIRLSIVLMAAMLASPALAQNAALEAVSVENAWSRATPPGAKVAAGYMRIVNSSDEPVTLERATADFANVELHSMSMANGVMMMAELPDGIEVGPGETVTLEPGGLHVMFIDIEAPFAEGETRAAILDFGDAGTLPVEFAVMGMGAMKGPGHTHH